MVTQRREGEEMLELLGRCQSQTPHLHADLSCVTYARRSFLQFSWPSPRRGGGLTAAAAARA